MAGVALDFFNQVLNDKKEALIKQMMMDYRSGIVDNIKLIGCTAAYTALDDLSNELKRMVNNGNKYQKEVIDNDGSNPPNH